MPRKIFWEYLETVQAALDRGENVLVHCVAGAHRAGTAAVAFVMWARALGYGEALTAVQGRRPEVAPPTGLMFALLGLETALEACGRS